MSAVWLALAMLGQAPADKPQAAVGRWHVEYRTDAEKYALFADSEHKQPLKLVEKPVMKWANDDDWSGDVFLWTRSGLPAVIGCMLSGPGDGDSRLMFHEFHLLDTRPIAAAELQTRRKWQPTAGLQRQPLANPPEPAETAAGRLTQMRRIAKSFTAHMEANGLWELRLLPQPLFRYGEEAGETVDGAIFAWVWSKGTDPEFILLVELRTGSRGLAWHYAPLRFSNRALWLNYENVEVWRAEAHKEPEGGSTAQIYTTAYARKFSREPAAPEPSPQPE